MLAGTCPCMVSCRGTCLCACIGPCMCACTCVHAHEQATQFDKVVGDAGTLDTCLPAGKSAWHVLPDHVVRDDLPTEKQLALIAARERRGFSRVWAV